MARRFAAFDIDGTIIRWQLYHALADELAKSGHLDPIQYEHIRKARLAWKERQDSASFATYETALINLINVAITGISPADIAVAGHSVLQQYKNQVYTYTRDLIAELKAKDYLLFAISGSQNELVSLLAEHYGFDDFGGSTYEIVNSSFTGKATVMRSQRKAEFLHELVAKHSADYTQSIAVGDSEGDIPMLSVVEQPIAFNPNKALFEHATANNWQIVVERKNMVYSLREHSGSYRLEA